MKKYLGGLITGILVSGLLFASVAVAENPIRLLINHKLIEGDSAPQLINNRIYVPIRVVAENLEAEVSWNAQNNTAYVFSKEFLNQGNKVQPTQESLNIEPQEYKTEKRGNAEITIKNTDLKVKSISTDNYEIFGEIENTSTSKTYKFMTINITAYDSSETAISSAKVILEQNYLEPKETGTFKWYFSNLALDEKKVNYFKVVIDKQD